MISRKLYLGLLWRVVLMAASGLGLGWILSGTAANILALVPAGVLVAIAINTLHFLNRVNRRLFFFFDSIRNQDSSLSFPDDGQTNMEKELYRTMEGVNHQIRQIHSENQRQEQYFMALIEHAATGMFTYNPKGFVLHSNQQVRILFGLNPFTHLSQLDNAHRDLRLAVEGIRPGQQNLHALTLEGEVVQLLIKASSILSEGEELMLLSVQDIRSELDEKEIDSWRRLIRVMRHEIMNSVTPITSLSESLASYFYKGKEMKAPEEIDRQTIETTLNGLELIHEQGEGLIRFVESYRELTRIPDPDKKLFSLAKLVNSMAVLAGSFPQAKNAEIVCESGQEEWEILADEQQISQVLINLLKNACQATVGIAEARVELRCERDPDGRPQVSVADNGPGIPDELMDKIFIPFFTTREDGSGIGLSLSRQIMQMHGGSLKIASAPGGGTEAILRF